MEEKEIGQDGSMQGEEQAPTREDIIKELLHKFAKLRSKDQVSLLDLADILTEGQRERTKA